MKQARSVRFPNESKQYRAARSRLLKGEIALRREMESVAALRRALPLGGRLKEDYVFEEMAGGKAKKVSFSKLFKNGKDTLIVYNWMLPDGNGTSCPSCTSILDGLNGSSPHVNDRVNFVVICKASIKKAEEWRKKRGWNNLKILSAEKNNFKTDYNAEINGNQWPMLSVFHKTPKGIYHFWSTELFFAKDDFGQDARHVDFLWPIWSLFDVTPEGRGAWYPKYSYD